MKSYLLLILLGLSCLTSLDAQIETSLAPFKHLKVLGAFDIELIPGDEERIEIRAYNFDEDKVKVSQQGKTLKLSTLRSIIDGAEIKVKLYYRELESISSGGGAEIDSDAPVVAGELYIRAGSGSEIYLTVDATQLEVQAAEGGHLTLKGKTDELKAGANTGGIFDGHRLTSAYAHLRAGTGGEVSAMVTEELEARANTGGSIRYGGDPTSRDEKTILGGQIHRL